MSVETLGVTGVKCPEQSILAGQLPTGLMAGSSVKTRQASFLSLAREAPLLRSPHGYPPVKIQVLTISKPIP